MQAVRTFSTKICPKIDEFWGWNFENLSPGLESAPPRYHVYQFSGKTDNFGFSA